MRIKSTIVILKIKMNAKEKHPANVQLNELCCCLKSVKLILDSVPIDLTFDKFERYKFNT